MRTTRAFFKIIGFPFPERCWLVSLVSILLVGSTERVACAAEPGQADASTIVRLNSKEPFGAVHIPFKLEEGVIVVKACVNGKSLDCILDTGSSEAFSAPASLQLKGAYTRSWSIGIDIAGRVRIAKAMRLSTLILGGYELRNLDAFEMQPSTIKKDQNAVIDQHSVIGNAAFAHVVLTIDYRKQELLLRRPDYDLLHQPRQPQDLVYDFTLSHADDTLLSTQQSMGVPVLHSMLQGHPFNLEIDTGWDGEEMGVTRAYLKAHPALSKQTGAAHASPKILASPLFSAPVAMDAIPETIFCLGGNASVIVHRPAILIPVMYQGVDGIIGYDILQHFRVTLDYPHKRILLEPYKPNFRAALFHYDPALVDAGHDPVNYLNPSGHDVTIIIGGVSVTIKSGTPVTIDGSTITVDGPPGSTVTVPGTKGPITVIIGPNPGTGGSSSNNPQVLPTSPPGKQKHSKLGT